MSEREPGHYAVIPTRILFDKELTDKAKLLYGLISSLANKKGYCWAENKYFEEQYGVSEATIRQSITLLCDKQYLRREIIYHDDTKNIKERRLYINDCPKNTE